jgi:hypothetical protein
LPPSAVTIRIWKASSLADLAESFQMLFERSGVVVTQPRVIRAGSEQAKVDRPLESLRA